ncbi:MAG: hypothetical protein CMI54_02470 [Parcubacteria group bacterium]|nr:hypothetical protein [Parcubacteria group bacterium]|tara:strand:+ start:12364 stop:13152 length:789 start_codon:yes stop_codon:yes gene_type:complete
MKNIICFSGGKDSTALILWAKENQMEFETVFCDTGWEHPLTYKFIGKINRELLDGKLIILKSKKYRGGMTTLVEARHRVPSIRARFCTEELKIKPVLEYLKTINDEYQMFQGIRAEESIKRSKLKPKEWSDLHDCYINFPLLFLTAEEIFAIHKKYGIDPNPLYKLNSSRVGCYPCVLSGVGEFRRLDKQKPNIWERAKMLEQLSNKSFFQTGTIPDRWCSKDFNGVKVPTVEDVQAYIRQWDGQQELFETPACMSVYNLCE